MLLLLAGLMMPVQGFSHTNEYQKNFVSVQEITAIQEAKCQKMSDISKMSDTCCSGTVCDDCACSVHCTHNHSGKNSFSILATTAQYLDTYQIFPAPSILLSSGMLNQPFRPPIPVL